MKQWKVEITQRFGFWLTVRGVPLVKNFIKETSCQNKLSSFFLEVLVCYVFVVSGNFGSKTATLWIFNKMREKRTFVYVHHFKFQEIWDISF